MCCVRMPWEQGLPFKGCTPCVPVWASFVLCSFGVLLLCMACCAACGPDMGAVSAARECCCGQEQWLRKQALLLAGDVRGENGGLVVLSEGDNALA